MKLNGLRIGLVGPLPPPSGGMANQTAQLAALLDAEGAVVELIQVNRPCYPKWAAGIKGVRALLRLLPYLRALWQAGKRVDLFHVMANSGWSWHLYAAPAIWIAKLRSKPVIINYRGGEAETFFTRNQRLVAASMNRADAIIVPSSFLADVFEKFGFRTQIVPNIIDLKRFSPGPARQNGIPLVLVARNLEAIYDNASALRAFAIVKESFPTAQLCIAGSGPELAALERLALSMGMSDAIKFAGRIENAAMAELYGSATIVLNPSLADNMPNSVLEALACGVPVVSTDVGGVPQLLRHDVTGILVKPGAHHAMADAIITLLSNPVQMRSLSAAGLQLIQQFSWPQVAPLLLAEYRRVMRKRAQD